MMQRSERGESSELMIVSAPYQQFAPWQIMDNRVTLPYHPMILGVFSSFLVLSNSSEQEISSRVNEGKISERSRCEHGNDQNISMILKQIQQDPIGYSQRTGGRISVRAL